MHLSFLTTTFLLRVALPTTQVSMQSSSRPRKKNTPVDFVMTKYKDQYPHDVIQSLVTRFGLKLNIEMLQSCADEKRQLQGKDRLKKSQRFYNNYLKPNMEQLHANTEYLQSYTQDEHGSHPGSAAFYEDCAKALTSMLRSSSEIAPDLKDGIEDGMSMKQRILFEIQGYSFRTCYYLATINGQEKRVEIIKCINFSLKTGGLSFYLSTDVMKTVSAGARKIHALMIVLMKAVEKIMGTKSISGVDMRLLADEIKVQARLESPSIIVMTREDAEKEPELVKNAAFILEAM